MPRLVLKSNLNKKKNHIRFKQHLYRLRNKQFQKNAKSSNEFEKPINNFSQNHDNASIDDQTFENLNIHGSDNEQSDEECFEEFENNEEEELSADDKKEYINFNPNEFIYDRFNKGSSFTNEEFNITFTWLCLRLKLSINHRNLLLHFIKNLLPPNNKISSSYYLISKKLREKIKMRKQIFKICSNCYNKYEKKCNNDQCVNKKKKLCIDVAYFDFQQHLKLVLKKNWSKIIEYKSKLNFKLFLWSFDDFKQNLTINIK